MAAITLFLACAALVPCVAQDASPEGEPAAASEASSSSTPATPSFPTPTFSAGIALGSDVFISGAGESAQTWTRLGFEPELAIGKIGVGLDLTLHLRFYDSADQALTIYGGDWIPNYQNNGRSFFDVYLPKLLYLRYGQKGSDPLFAKLGSMRDMSLGNGFIMSDYSNMLFMPELRIFGLDAGVDGSLFGFPYVGVEAIAGNLARLDVLGARVYGRPLLVTGIPIIKDLQIGATFVGDRDPYLYASTSASAQSVAAYGLDLLVPILSGPVFPLAAYTDLAVDPNQSLGYMLGAGGKLLGIVSYGAQLRFLQDGFIPSYFDSNYDLYRAARYQAMQASHGSDFTPSWFASLGASFLSDKLVFSAALDGPFAIPEPAASLASASQGDYPHLRGIARLGQIEKLPIYFDASYDKYLIGASKGFFPDLVDPTDAVIGLDINYKTGAAVLTLAYAAKWNPYVSKFEVTSSLQAAVKF
jgi:hypothetical protein